MDNSLGLAALVWQFRDSNVSLHDYSLVVRWFCSVSVGWASFGRQTDIFTRKIYLHNFSQVVVLSFAVCRQEDDLAKCGRMGIIWVPGQMLEGATLAFHKPPAPKLSGRVQNRQNVPNSAKLCGHLNCY